jgi:hypothetical protein
MNHRRKDRDNTPVGPALVAGPRLTPKTIHAAARKQGKTISEVAEERLVVA